MKHKASDLEMHIHHYKSKLLGWLELRFSDGGLTSIDFVTQPHPRIDNSKRSFVKKACIQLDEYFSHKRREFDLILDMNTGTSWYQKVWKELSRIPYGETRSYRDIAKAVDNPEASRAVGLANKNNPIPIIVPCHRVIKSDGSLGGYNSGIDTKKLLLLHEGIKLS
jgi:methylated-DNA-[protein]-cysteine S-methyltransferase